MPQASPAASLKDRAFAIRSMGRSLGRPSSWCSCFRMGSSCSSIASKLCSKNNIISTHAMCHAFRFGQYWCMHRHARQLVQLLPHGQMLLLSCFQASQNAPSQCLSCAAAACHAFAASKAAAVFPLHCKVQWGIYKRLPRPPIVMHCACSTGCQSSPGSEDSVSWFNDAVSHTSQGPLHVGGG